MLAKLLVMPFGSIWNLRSKYQSSVISKVAKLIYEIYQYENGSSIAWNAKFDSEPCFPHGMKSIFVSGSARIGKNCVIFQQVTIGSVTLPDSKGKGSPTIGDNVYIGAGAKIVGAVKIGNNVRIGANTTVYKDVPDNSVVISGEQKTITKDNPIINKYYSYVGYWVYFEDGVFKRELDDAIVHQLNNSNIVD